MTTPSKIDLLLAICEHPGWEPPENCGSSCERWLEELKEEGLIAPRLDGWEATPRALLAYPGFGLDEGGRILVQTPVATEPQQIAIDDPRPAIPHHRVVVLLRGLLEDVPVVQLVDRITTPESAYAPVEELWDLARGLTTLLE